MIDPRGRGGCDRGLGMVGDAETGCLDHAEVVGAVANHQRIEIVEIECLAQFDQGCELRVASQDRLCHGAGKLAVLDQQGIGAIFLEADHRGDGIGEEREAARHEAGIGTMRAHGADQFAAARRQRDAAFQCLIDDADRLLEDLRITHIRHSPASALSGGERRRVEIARALASKPSFMLLDEPFAGIDPLAITDIREVITYLKGRGIGILITDHNVRETLEIVDRASIIHSGEVLFEGTADQITQDPEVRRVYLGEGYHL